MSFVHNIILTVGSGDWGEGDHHNSPGEGVTMLRDWLLVQHSADVDTPRDADLIEIDPAYVAVRNRIRERHRDDRQRGRNTKPATYYISDEEAKTLFGYHEESSQQLGADFNASRFFVAWKGGAGFYMYGHPIRPREEQA